MKKKMYRFVRDGTQMTRIRRINADRFSVNQQKNICVYPLNPRHPRAIAGFDTRRLSYWCCSLSRSFTVFTGLNVVKGTSTKMVLQSLMAPFHNPGNSSAFSSLPFFDL